MNFDLNNKNANLNIEKNFYLKNYIILIKLIDYLIL